MSSPLEKENVFPFVWTLKVDKFKPTKQVNYFNVWSVYKKIGYFFQLIPTSSLGEQPWTLINKRALSSGKSTKQKTGNSHMSSASPTQIPLYPLHTVKKAIANRMTSKAVKLDPSLLMSCCAVSEAVKVGLVSDCCPQNASLPWCLSSGRDVWVSRRFQVCLFFCL